MQKVNNPIEERMNNIGRIILSLNLGVLLTWNIMTAAGEIVDSSRQKQALILRFNKNGPEVMDECSNKTCGFSYSGKDKADLYTPAGKIGGGFQFDGINDYVKILPKPELEIKDFISMEAWIYATGTDDSKSGHKSDGRFLIAGYKNDRARLWLNNKKQVYFEIWEGSRPVKCHASPYVSVNLNEWVHIQGEYDRERDRISIIINGKRYSKPLFLTEAVLPSAAEADRQLFIGGVPGRNRYFQGKIDEIVISGRQLKKAGSAFTGRPPDKITSERRGKKGSWVLENGKIGFGISPDNGNISGAWNKFSPGKDIEKGVDLYWAEYKTDHRIEKSSELDDRIISSLRKKKAGRDILTLKCINSSLGVEIVKEYEISANDNKLIKRVTFSTAKEVMLFKYASGITLTSEFITGGYFHHLGRVQGYDKSIIYPEEVAGKRNIYWSSQVCLVNPGKGYGVGEYKYRVNGRYDLPSAGELVPSYLVPAGWEIGISGEFLKKDQPFSAETHYVIFEGDAVDFHQGYMALADFAGMRENFKTPAWVKEVRFVLGWCGVHQLGKVIPGPALRSLTGRNEPILGWPISPWFDWSIDVRGDWLDGELDDPSLHFYSIARQELKTLKRVQNDFPWIRVGNYTWPWSLGQKSKVYREHPQWVVYDEEGNPVVLADILKKGVAYRANPAAPGYIDYQMERVRKVIRKLNYKVYNTDGTGGCTYADWKSEKVIHTYHWLDYFGRLRETVRECGKDNIYMPNGNFYAAGIQADCGFLEHGERWVDPNDNHGPYNWRIFADKIRFAKLYQYKDRWIAPIFWGHANIKNVRNNDPWYSNYIIAFGLKPSHPCEADYNELGSLWLSLKSKMPYINAAYEMKEVKLIDGDISPCWWNNRETELEAYTTRQGNAYFIPVINHTDIRREVIVSADFAKMGSPPNTLLFAWEFAMTDPWEVTGKNSAAGELDRRMVIKRKYRGMFRLKNSRRTFSIGTDPYLLNMIMVTSSPAVVFSVNGRKNQLLLPQTLGTKISGQLDQKNKKCCLSVHSTDDKVKIMAFYPRLWGSCEVVLNNNQQLSFTEMNDFEERFILFEIPADPRPRRIEIRKSARHLTARDNKVIEVCQTANAPVIDGKFEDPAWKKASQCGKFVTSLGGKVKEGTEVHLTYDSKNLYLFFKCSQESAPKSTVLQYDGPVYHDDHVEIFIDVNNDRKTYYHLLVNAMGTKGDEKCDPFVKNTDWNGAWQAVGSAGKGGWTMEVSIPFKTLGVNNITDGTTWGFNLCRGNPEKNEWSIWSCPNGINFHAPEYFGKIKFKKFQH
ncbi:MAG: sugar-binding protein [Victivallaceae bacterium]|nr:sugar-binding protein [Victivallaceae bacterium]